MGQAILPIMMVTGFAGGVMEGMAGAATSRAAAQQAKIRESAAKTAADQTYTKHSEELISTIANINAIRASTGADPLSPTSRAVKTEERRVSERDRQISVDNLNAQASAEREAARAHNRNARWQLGMGIVGGINKAAGGYLQYGK